jgi:hypothetical protein
MTEPLHTASHTVHRCALECKNLARLPPSVTSSTSFCAQEYAIYAATANDYCFWDDKKALASTGMLREQVACCMLPGDLVPLLHATLLWRMLRECPSARTCVIQDKICFAHVGCTTERHNITWQ